MTALKNSKSAEELLHVLFHAANLGDPKLQQRTLEYAISPDVRSQDSLGLLTGVMFNASDGGKMAWDFIVSHWDAAQKAGGSFASAQIVQATGSFCDAQMRSPLPHTEPKRQNGVIGSRSNESTHVLI